MLLAISRTYLRFVINDSWIKSRRFMAVRAMKGGGSGGGAKKKVVHEIEKDAQKLSNFVCGLNYRIDEERGEEVHIKPDSEYPEWLFTMDMSGQKKPLDQIPPGTIEYYERLREERLKIYRKKQKTLKSYRYLAP
uniref:Large ribosomal subunit protein mL54 n=1 Tax=Lepeophtheirus salmonis TaxID=72036 RepID=A0A0K2UQX8_LEPSM